MKNRVRLRNKIASFLNAQEALGCKVHPGAVPSSGKPQRGPQRFFARLVMGVAKDGRTIALYPTIHLKERVPLIICRYLADLEKRGALVGTVGNIGAAWDIVADDPSQWKRKKNTFLHQYWLEKYNLERQ